MLHTSAAIAVGVVITLLLGLLVGPLIKTVENQTTAPEPQKTSKEIWDVIMARGGSGPTLGAIEELIFFLAIWTDGWALLASWLAFKVASKWQSWTHVAQFPGPPQAEDAAAVQEYVILRHKWVARRYMTFVVGTGANIVVAALGVSIGRIILASG